MKPPLLVYRSGDYVRIEDSEGKWQFDGDLKIALLHLGRLLVQLHEARQEIAQLKTTSKET